MKTKKTLSFEEVGRLIIIVILSFYVDEIHEQIKKTIKEINKDRKGDD